MFNLQQGRRAGLHALWEVAFGGGPVAAVTCAWRANFGAEFFRKASAVGFIRSSFATLAHTPQAAARFS